MQFAHFLAAILYGSDEIYFPSHQRDGNIGLNAEQDISQFTFIYALFWRYTIIFCTKATPIALQTQCPVG